MRATAAPSQGGDQLTQRNNKSKQTLFGTDSLFQMRTWKCSFDANRNIALKVHCVTLGLIFFFLYILVKVRDVNNSLIID